jgi:hypothetical protein
MFDRQRSQMSVCHKAVTSAGVPHQSDHRLDVILTWLRHEDIGESDQASTWVNATGIEIGVLLGSTWVDSRRNPKREWVGKPTSVVVLFKTPSNQACAALCSGYELNTT